jgi:hypothetical protein
VAVTVEWESEERRMERCDHEGTTEALAGGSISRCMECGKTWPSSVSPRRNGAAGRSRPWAEATCSRSVSFTWAPPAKRRRSRSSAPLRW